MGQERGARRVHVIVLPPVGAGRVQLLPHVQAALALRAGHGVVQDERDDERDRRPGREDGVENVCAPHAWLGSMTGSRRRVCDCFIDEQAPMDTSQHMPGVPLLLLELPC